MSDLKNSSPLFGSAPSPDDGRPLPWKLADEPEEGGGADREQGRPNRLDREPPQHSELRIRSDSVDSRTSFDTSATNDMANPTDAEYASLALPPLAPLLGPILQLNPLQVEVSPEVIGRGGAQDPEADAALLESMRRDGTNAEPALVRRLPPVDGQAQRYQVIHGQRRLWACRELKLPLRAQVEHLSPLEVLRYAVSSHAGWQAHALIDQGHWAKARLASGQFPTADALCKFTGWDPGSLSRCISLAEFPRTLTELFARSKGFQHRHVSPLNKLLQDNPQRLLARARAVAKLNEKVGFKMTAMELFDALLLKKVAEEKLKRPRNAPCADCVFSPSAAVAAAEAAQVDWRSNSPTKSPVVDDDGFELADVSSDADGFTSTRYSFPDLTQSDREWLAQEELGMLRRSPFYIALRMKDAGKGGTL